MAIWKALHGAGPGNLRHARQALVCFAGLLGPLAVAAKVSELADKVVQGVTRTMEQPT
jgi:hypothetical protein